MKSFFYKLTCVFLLNPVLAFGKPKTSSAILTDDEKIQIISTLIKNQDIAFTPTEDKHIGCPKNETLASYLSMLIVHGSQGDKHWLKVSCENLNRKKNLPQQPTNDSFSKRCRLSAFTSDKAGESPWNYEFVFHMSSDFKSLDKANFSCPGV